MGRQTTSDFVVDTIGHCFICLIQLPPRLLPVKPEPDTSGSFHTHSLRDLSRYLKIQMKKVFHDNENDSIPGHLLDKVERSTLKVSLCEECATWNAKLSQLFQQLEKIEVEAASYLELIDKKFLAANENGRTAIFRKKDDCNSTDRFTENLKLDIAEAIRGETMQKCSLKLNKVQPKIKIKAMAQKEILSRIRPCSNLSSQNIEQGGHHGQIAEYLAASDVSNDDVKFEYVAEASNEYFEDMDHQGQQDEDFGRTHIPQEMEGTSRTTHNTYHRYSGLEYQKYASKTVPSSDHLKHRKKLATGKFSCDLCSKEFVGTGAFYNHYQEVHRKIRFQCSICNKIFTKRANLKRHQRSAY